MGWKGRKKTGGEMEVRSLLSSRVSTHTERERPMQDKTLLNYTHTHTQLLCVCAAEEERYGEVRARARTLLLFSYLTEFVAIISSIHFSLCVCVCVCVEKNY